MSNKRINKIIKKKINKRMKGGEKLTKVTFLINNMNNIENAKN